MAMKHRSGTCRRDPRQPGRLVESPTNDDRHTHTRAGLGLGLLFWLASGCAWAGADSLSALKQLSLEDLANLEVSIASNRSERLQDSAAAVFVLTSEDIRRSGATSVLRYVPGINVARISASEWAVTSRVGNNQFADKLLVMVDGRSIYTPLFSGVMWDENNIVLQDVERIEVVRGPGASTWGANAVNGVINIITKNAEDTQGSRINLVAGPYQREVVARTGFALAEGHARVYAKLHDQDELDRGSVNIPPDSDWQGGRVGFRTDWDGNGGHLMTQGEIYKEFVDNRQPNGGHLLARWEQKGDDGTLDSLQGYFNVADLGHWTGGGNSAEGGVTTLDVDYHHEFQRRGGHLLTGGLGYRAFRLDATALPPAAIDQSGRTYRVYSAFLQDDITLKQDRLYLTLGLKTEHNDFTGMELQPSARLRWSPEDRGTFWASVSRAVRTPTIVETGMTVQDDIPPENRIIPGTPGTLRLSGNPDFNSETLLAYELGYRIQAASTLNLDATIYRFEYDRLSSDELQGLVFPSPTDPTRFLLLASFGNNIKGQANGLEFSAEYRPAKAWRLRAAYAYMDASMEAKPGSTDANARQLEGTSPHHQFSLGSSYDPSDRVELDLWGRYVGPLSTFQLKGYFTVDARLGWRPGKNLEVALVGHNLVGPRHKEFEEYSGVSSAAYLVPRELYLTMNWRF